MTLTRSLTVQDGLDETVRWMDGVEESLRRDDGVALTPAAVGDALSKEAVRAPRPEARPGGLPFGHASSGTRRPGVSNRIPRGPSVCRFFVVSFQSAVN